MISRRAVVRHGLNGCPPGAALLEALAAITIIAIGGLMMLESLVVANNSVTNAYRAEEEVVRAADLLDAALLWSTEELTQRLGTRPQGPFLLTIERPTLSLYTVTVSDAASSRRLMQSATIRNGETKQ